MRSFPSQACALLLALLTTLAACDDRDQAEKATAAVPPSGDAGEIVLAEDSPKRAYIKEAVASLAPRPLLEPLPGKIVYDETRTVRVRSPIAGRVLTVAASLGAKVRKGSGLLELDSPELGQAQADYRDALADLALAGANYQRTRDLFEHGILPRKEFDQIQDSLTRAKTEVERTRLRLANLGITGDRTDNRFTLQAPIAGSITEVRVNPGMEVRSDREEPLFVISDTSQLWLLMDVYEKDLALIQPDQRVTVSVPAYPSETFEAVVDTIGKLVDETTRTVKVRCKLASAHNRLLPSMYATVEIHSGPEDRAIIVPLTALFTEGESDWLFVALGEGRYRQREVEIGFRMKDRAVIRKGLQSGERIVVDGALMLRSEEDNIEQTGESGR